jgi:hypothetical protein
MISFKVSIAAVQSADCSFTIILHILKLSASSVNLNAQLFNLVMGKAELLEEILILALVVAQRFKIALQLLVDFALNELLERFVLLGLGNQLNVRLLGKDELVLSEFLLVGVKLLFEERDFILVHPVL